MWWSNDIICYKFKAKGQKFHNCKIQIEKNFASVAENKIWCAFHVLDGDQETNIRVV